MVLGLTKAYTPSSGQVANSSSYNTDITALFNAFSGLEAQTSTLGGLTITPSANSTTLLKITNAAGEVIFAVDTTNGDIVLEDTGKVFLDGSTAGAGGNTYIHESAADKISFVAGGTEAFRIVNDDIGIAATGKIFLDGVALSGNTYIQEASSDLVNVVVNNGVSFTFRDGSCSIPTSTHISFNGAANTDTDLGDASSGAGTATLYIGNASINVTSDIRIKKDITDTNINALEIISKLKVKDFVWDDPSDKAINNRNSRGRWTGLIAQEAVDVCPFIVNAPRPEGKEIDYNSEQRWFIEYDNFVPVLIKSIQELSAKIAILEAK